MANLINLENVSKSFGVKPLLDGVSLGVEEGERIGVVGLNGGGKTTMLEVLAGVEQPDSGRVSRVGGLRMAVVTQRGVLLPAPLSVKCPGAARSGATRMGRRRAHPFGALGYRHRQLGRRWRAVRIGRQGRRPVRR